MSRNRKLVLCKNEKELIRQIKEHPVIWDKAHKDYRKPSTTENSWVEIADSVKEDVTNCKKRWKSLRDTFIKYYRIELTKNPLIQSKKDKNWIYYKDLCFLKPNVELFGINESLDTSKIPDPLAEQAQTTEHTIYEIEYQIENEEEMEAETEILQMPRMSLMKHDGRQIHSQSLDEQQTEYIIEPSEEKVQEYGVRRIVEKEKSVETSVQRSVDTSEELLGPSPTKNYMQFLDSDEKFLLSCAPALKRLTPRQNSYIRLSIQKLLFDVEFGNADEAADRKFNKKF